MLREPRFFAVIALVSGVSLALLPCRPARSVKDGRKGKREQVAVAWFAHMFKSYASDPRRLVFVSVEEGDPSRLVLAQLRAHRKTVLEGSRALRGPSYVKDRLSGRKGIRFILQALTIKTEDSADVQGAWLNHARNGATGRYTLERKNGVWGVTSGRIVGRY